MEGTQVYAGRLSFDALCRKAARIARTMCLWAGVLFILMCALAFSRVPFDAHRWLGTAGGVCEASPDRIIVLGGSGMPSGPELLRLDYAAKAANAFPSATVLVVHPLDTATVRRMVEELELRGVDPGRISMETRGTNTREQALNIARALAGAKGERVALVTAPENMYRSLRVFRKLGFARVTGIPAFDNPMFVDLGYRHGAIGGKPWTPDVSGDLALRYNFWNYLKLEVTCLREYMAIAYYWMNDWI